MNSQKQFELIRGVFESFEAKEVLLCLIDGKIKFHNHKIFSEEERFGVKNANSIQRIKELSEAREQVLKLLDDCESNGTRLSIHSQIFVELLAKSEVA